jgi:hypothetical protein
MCFPVLAFLVKFPQSIGLPLRASYVNQKLRLICAGDKLEPQLGSFPPKEVDLMLAMTGLVEYCAAVDELHAVAEHSVHQPS